MGDIWLVFYLLALKEKLKGFSKEVFVEEIICLGGDAISFLCIINLLFIYFIFVYIIL